MTTMSDQLDQLATALAAAQAEFTAIPKDSTNPFFKSKYAGLPQVIETASPILTKHGLSVCQMMGYNGDHDTLTTWLLHKSGQFIVDEMRLHLVKEDPQGHGSATTYARRYAYMSALGLVADQDDDGNAASRPAAPRQQPPPTRSKSLPVALRDELKRLYIEAGWQPPKLRAYLKDCGVIGVDDLSVAQAEKLRDLLNSAIDVEAPEPQ